MRKTVPVFEAGDTRIISKFLWLPVQIGGDWRWFERAKIKQVLKYSYFGYVGDGDIEFWENIEFVD